MAQDLMPHTLEALNGEALLQLHALMGQPAVRTQPGHPVPASTSWAPAWATGTRPTDRGQALVTCLF